MNKRDLMVIAGLKQQSVVPFQKRLTDFLYQPELIEYRKLPKSKQLDWLAGRIAIKRAYMDLINPNVNIMPRHHRTGEPYINNKIFCSISHSHGRAVSVVSHKRVGIDIEKVRRHKKVMLDYIATNNESNLFDGSLNEKITAIWTIKESVMKAVGIGLGLNPNQLKISKNRRKFIVNILDNRYTRESKWNVLLYKVAGYYISLAHQHKLNDRPKIRWYKPTSLSIAKI